jgi:hypothetical protein
VDQALHEVALLAGRPELAGRIADRRSRPAPPAHPEGARPPGQSKYWVYGLQVFLAAVGAVGGVHVLDSVFDLSDLSYWTTVAGAVGGITGTPVARMLFRRAELRRKDANAEALAKQSVNRRALTEQTAIGKYLVAQLLNEIAELREQLLSNRRPPVNVSPYDADYTDRVRAAVERAHLDNLPPAGNETAEQRDVRAERVAALDRIDRLAAAVDWADSANPAGSEAAEARARLTHAISLYEAIAGEDGVTKSFPVLPEVSPARGQRVTGGPTDQIRAGAARVVARMLGEPAGKPLLKARLEALERIVQAADAMDVHGNNGALGAGRAESLAHVQQELDARIAAFEELLREANILGGFPRPAVSPARQPGDGPEAFPSALPGRVGEVLELTVTRSGLTRPLPTDLVADPEVLAALESRWTELAQAGFEVKVTVTRVARPTPAADPLRLTVEVTDPHATAPHEATDVYGPRRTAAELVREMITDQQSAPGRHRARGRASDLPGRHRMRDLTSDGSRHRMVDDDPVEADNSPDPNHTSEAEQVPYVVAARFDPAAGTVSGEVVSSESRNRARWSFGAAGQPDQVVLELREVHPAERLPVPGTQTSEALPPLALDWAFARDRARGLIPPGVEVSAREFAALEQRVKELIAAGQEVTLVLRAVAGPAGRPELTVAADVRSGDAVDTYGARPLADMVDALGKHQASPAAPTEPEETAAERSAIAQALNPARSDRVPEWARGNIPSGVEVSTHELLDRLDQRVRRLTEAGQQVDVHLRTVPRADGRPVLTVAVAVTDRRSGLTKVYRSRPVAALIGALDKHHIRPAAPAEQEQGSQEQDSGQPEAAQAPQSMSDQPAAGDQQAQDGQADEPGRTSAEMLRDAARRLAAENIARQALRLAGLSNEPTATTDNPNAPGTGRPDSGPGRVGHAPRVDGSRFVEDGREQSAGALSRDAILDAARQLRLSDFGELLKAPITVTGDSVVVVAADGVVHTFRIEEPAPVRPGRLAATQVGTGNEHGVVVAPGVADDQLARLLVHEISHTLQDVKAAEATPVRRLWNKLTGGGPNPCVEAQFNESRYLRRQWAAAVERGDDAEVRLLEQDIRGLAAAIEHHGRTPPALPWEGSPIPGPRAELRAEIEARQQALDDEIAMLQGLIDTKKAAADKAVGKADEESEKATKAGRAKDEGRYGRVRAAEAEATKQKDLAEWHRQVADNYGRAQAKAIAARDGYGQLLAGFDASTTDDLQAEATRLADEVASYQHALDQLSPQGVVAAMTPTDELPHLPALVKQVNAVLAARGIDERFTAAGLQSRLNAGFGALAGEDGVILRVGREKTAELRIRLQVTRLREVPGPPKTAGEIMRGRFPQPARRVATTMTSRFNQTYSRSVNDVLEWLGGFTHVPWLSAVVLSLLAVKAEVSVGDSRAVTATGAEFAQDGAVEDIRGESVMFSGRASYQVDLRTDRKSGWSPAQTVAGTDELRAWIPHTYTVPAATQVEQREDLQSGRLPAHLLSTISGLEGLTDTVIADNDKELRRLGSQRGHVEDQIHAALTTDLPGRLAESTRRPVLRPLMAGGKPIGYIEVTTTIRYKSVALAGAQSVTHWQESVRVGQSVVSVQQTFGSNGSESVGLGPSSADNGGSGIGFALGASAARAASRSESLFGGSTAYQVGVHRFVGPTQGYQMVLDHDVTVVLNDEAPKTTPGSSDALMRVRVTDAYRSGLPVDSAALVRPDGRPGLQGEVQSGVEVPGRKLELPSWATDNGKLRAAGPWNIQEVTGGERAFRKIVEYLADRGFVPPLDADHNPDLTKLSTDPIERHGQILNLEELRTQLSTERLEAGYDVAARGGIVVTLNLPSSRRPTETISLRIGIDQHEVREPVGVTTDEAVVFLNIGSDTAGRSGGRTRAFTAQGRGGPERSVDGADVKSGLSYGRQFLGRALSWLSGGTINQVTLVESASPVAVFEVPHTLTVTEIGTGAVIHESTGESARLLIDSDFLPYADSPSGDPSPWESEQRDPGPVPVAVLDRATLLAIGDAQLADQLPEAITSDPATLQQLSAFLNPRNLLAHPEWARTGLPTTIVVPGPDGIPRRVPVTVTGRIRDPKAVGQTEGTAGDINFALGSHGVSSARPTGHSGEVGTSESEESVGGGLKVTAGRSGSRSRTDQHIWGVERLTIETGRHYVFDAIVDLELTIGDAAPVHLESGVVFQVPERDVLRFYGEGKLTLSLLQAADAVERYLHDDLTLDRRTIGGLLRRYHAELTQARASGTTVPELSAAHTTKALADKFWRPSPNPSTPNAPQPGPDDHEGRLQQALLRAQHLPRVELPAHYREHLGSSLIESARLEDGTADVQLLDEVRAMLIDNLSVDLEHDPALAQSLFADLAGKRWLGRLEDMLGPRGFVRRYPVGRPGDLTAEQVEIRITARFAGEVLNLGSTKDVVSIVQRYLYDDRSRTRSTGRAAGIGADGLLGDLPSGSVTTDRADGSSTTTAEQLTRLERIALFGELNRLGRDFELVVEVTRDAVDPTRGDIARTLGADEKVIARAGRTLHGNLVQLVPTAMLGGQANQAPEQQVGDRTAVPEPGTAVRMPPTYFVEGVGPGRFDQPDLFEAVVGEFEDLLGPDGVRVYQPQLENQLAASAVHGEFSRMATEEGFQLQPMTKPGSAGETVDVTVHARISNPELVSGPLPNGELGDINRFQRTVSTSTGAGRSLPITGAGSATAAESGVGVRVSAGEQMSGTTTDTWGARDEVSRMERGDLVTVRVRVDYDLTVVHRAIGPDGSEINLASRYRPGLTTGEAYLTLFEHDYRELTRTKVVRSPEVEDTRYVADGRRASDGKLKPADAVAAALGTRSADFGGLITADPAIAGERTVVVRQGDSSQYFSVQVGDADHGMAFTELHAGTELDPHVVTFAPGIATHQLARVWVHEISHTLQELAAQGRTPLRRITGALTTNGENACVDAQYNEFRFLVRQWSEAVTSDDPRSQDDIRRDAEGLARAIEARGFRPPAIPWLTHEELIEASRVRHQELIPDQPTLLHRFSPRPRVVLLDGAQGADLRAMQERILAGFDDPDSVVRYDPEDDCRAHPRYEAIMREWGASGSELIGQAVLGVGSLSLEPFIEGADKYDVILTVPAGRTPRTKSCIADFDLNDYRVSVVYVALHETTRLLGRIEGYQSGRDLPESPGRPWAPLDWHDLAETELPDLVHLMETGDWATDIYVVTPEGDVLHENHQDMDGTCEREPAARDTYVAERDRPPTPLERACFEAVAAWLLYGRAGLPPLENEVEQAVLTAISRELTRPEPRPDDRQFGEDDKIENRLRRYDDPIDRNFEEERRWQAWKEARWDEDGPFR